MAAYAFALGVSASRVIGEHCPSNVVIHEILNPLRGTETKIGMNQNPFCPSRF
jgi:hypothetical protein